MLCSNFSFFHLLFPGKTKNPKKTIKALPFTFYFSIPNNYQTSMPPKEKPKETNIWKEVSGETFSQIQAIKLLIKDYSYQDQHTSQVTDERFCSFLLGGLAKAKKQIYNISDLCFCLHIGEHILPLTDLMRDELDIFSDEIKIRHCHWRDIDVESLKKIVKQDLSLLKGVEQLNRNLEIVYSAILTESKKGKPAKEFWKKIKDSLVTIRKHLRELVILFKEREILCNLHPLTLERTFKKMQEEIREKV